MTLCSKYAFCVAWLAVLSGACLQTATAGVEDCGVLQNHGDVGPWDYADPSSSVGTGADPMGRIKRVENVHFKPDIRNLNTKRYSIEQLTAEISYTLGMFPNHPDALLAISRLEKLAGGKLPQAAASIFMPRISTYCFFDRALRFRPDDKAVHLSYAIYLHQQGRNQQALEQYLIAEPAYRENRYFHYDIGLLYAEMKNWDKAAEHARLAYAEGVDFPALRQKLEKAGYKIDLPVANPESTDSRQAPGDTDSSSEGKTEPRR